MASDAQSGSVPAPRPGDADDLRSPSESPAKSSRANPSSQSKRKRSARSGVAARVDALDQHGDVLFAYASTRLGQSADAEDVVQETMLAAIASDRAPRDAESDRAWLIGICRHKVVDTIRRRKRNARAATLVPTPKLGDGEGTAGLYDKRGRWKPKLRDWGMDPAEVLENTDFWRVYDLCRARLPEALAEAYILRELEGLEPTDVADTLGISPNNLAVRLHRARLMLRSCLERSWFQT